MEENTTITARALTRGELKRLRDAGLGPGMLAQHPEKTDEAVDMILDMVAGPRADAIPNPEAMALFEAVIRETFPGEEKNLSRPGSGSDPAPGQPLAG